MMVIDFRRDPAVSSNWGEWGMRELAGIGLYRK
jgi:hypothetical protein